MTELEMKLYSGPEAKCDGDVSAVRVTLQAKTG